jgi:hypothetical protein
MAYKICMALFAVEDNKHVTEFTKFTSGNTTLIVPTIEFKGNPDDILEDIIKIAKDMVLCL